MWSLGLALIIQVFCIVSSQSNVLPGQVFTENGRPLEYSPDEFIAEKVARSGFDAGSPAEWNTDSEEGYGGVVDEAGAYPPNQNSVDDMKERENEKEEKEAPIHKREGQEEFATFVDPTQNRRLVSEKQLFHGGGYEKRAKIDGSEQASDDDVGDTLFIAVTTVCTAAAVFGLVAAAFVWRRVHNRHRAARESEYPHYGVTGPAKERSGNTSPVAVMDAKLASSAQLYHYQHTKQQIIAMEQSVGDAKGQDSDDSEGEEDEGDFSVYEYPGLAPTGDIEVTNPLFENTSPKTKTDPKLAQLEPGVHQRMREDQ